jgi:hypothetical protein
MAYRHERNADCYSLRERMVAQHGRKDGGHCLTERIMTNLAVRKLALASRQAEKG